MKRFFVLSIVLVFLGMPLFVSAGDELAWEKKLPFAAATIHYSIQGMEKGMEVLYIRENGKERATYRETVADMMGMKMTNRTIMFKTPEYIYSYDLEKQQGYKGVNPQKYMIEEYGKLSAIEQEKVRQNAKKMGVAYAEGMGGNIQPNAVEILGYQCDKVEITGGSSTFLIHDTDVALKTEMNMMGMKLTIVAESLEKGQVDDKKFEHPAGINAEVSRQSDEIAEKMAKQAILMLKDPENATQELGSQLGLPGGQVPTSKEDKEAIQQAEQVMKGLKGMLGK